MFLFILPTMMDDGQRLCSRYFAVSFSYMLNNKNDELVLKLHLYLFNREDGRYNTKVQLPTSQPFYLLRFTSPCQMVEGMYVREENVQFDDEDHNNKNSISGKVPMGANGGRNQHLLYCYYTPLGSK